MNERENLPSASNAYRENTSGIFLMPAKEYHDEKKGLSRGMALEILQRSLEHMRYSTDHPDEPTKFMEFGTLVHCATLEPETLAEQYHVTPETYLAEDGKKKNWHNGANFCKDWNKAHADRICITKEAETMVKACCARIRGNPFLASMLRVGHVERSCFAKCPQTGIWLRSRPDLLAWDRGGRLWVLDIKKTQDATARGFRKAIRNMRYDFQEAWYRRVLELLGYKVEGFLFCAVEEQPPHGLGIFKIAFDKVANQMPRVQQAIDFYAQAKEQNTWTGYTDEIQEIDWREAV